MATVQVIHPRIAREANGTVIYAGHDVSLGSPKAPRVYQFRPVDPENPDVDHQCEVTNEEDLARFQAIPEDYVIVGAQSAAPVKPKKKAAAKKKKA